jgi:hypothetical protein
MSYNWGVAQRRLRTTPFFGLKKPFDGCFALPGETKAVSYPEHVVAAILGHGVGRRDTAAHIYIRAQYLAERREALQRWGLYLDGLRRAHLKLAAG